MLRFSVLFFFIIFWSVDHVYAQSVELDSLKKRARTNPSIDVFKKITDFYYWKNIDSLIRYGDLQIQYATENQKEVKNRVMVQRGSHYSILADTASMLSTMKELDTLAMDTSIYAQYLKVLSRYHTHTSNIEQAISTLHRAISICSSAKLFEQAVDYKNDLAVILKQNNDFENAIVQLKQVFTESRNFEDFRVSIKAGVVLCEIYNSGQLANFDSAIYYGESALQLAKKNNYSFGIGMAKNMVISPLIRNNELTQAILYIRDVEVFNKERGLTTYQYYRCMDRGHIFLQQQRYDSALFWLNRGKAINPKSSGNNRLLYLIEKGRENFEEALVAYELYKAQTDSIVHARNKQEVSELDARLLAREKTKEVDNLKQSAIIQKLENEKQQIRFLGLVFLLLIVMTFGFIFFRYRKLQQQQATRDMEQRMLRLQMNPHFIFNALTSIQNYILENDTKESVTYLSRFARLMRQILDHSRVAFVSVEEEVDMLHNYMEIQQIRFQNRFEYSIYVDPEIDAENTKIPPLFAQPFVENAIEHGLKGKKKDGLIEIKITKEANKLRLEVLDNGQGIVSEPSSKSNHTSVSTLISKDRLDLYEKKFKSRFSLEVRKREDGISGTQASVLLPGSI